MFGMSGVASFKWNTTINMKKHINMGQYALRATQQFPFHDSDELIWKYQRSLMPYWTRVEQWGDHRWLLLWIQTIARKEGVHKNEILVGCASSVERRIIYCIECRASSVELSTAFANQDLPFHPSPDNISIYKRAKNQRIILDVEEVCFYEYLWFKYTVMQQSTTAIDADAPPPLLLTTSCFGHRRIICQSTCLQKISV
jgi:hypothetical protein